MIHDVLLQLDCLPVEYPGGHQEVEDVGCQHEAGYPEPGHHHHPGKSPLPTLECLEKCHEHHLEMVRKPPVIMVVSQE